MPKRFDAELESLTDKLVSMGDLAHNMVQTAMKALVDRDREILPRILEMEEQMDRYQVEIDDDAVRLMAIFGPVALELRFILMVARINTDLERVGDQAVNMCENIELLLAEPELKELIDLPRMSDIAANMVKDALKAFKTRSTEMALEVIKMDNKVDALNDQLFRELLTYMISDAATIKRALALILTARSLERIADHATNVAEEVYYLVKGEDIRHQAVEEIGADS